MSSAMSMSIHEAEHELAGLQLVPCTAGSLAEIKRLRDQCLAAGIPAVAAAPSAGRSCGAKAQLLIDEGDLQRVAAVLRNEWSAALAREGNQPVEVAMFADGEHLPCPACGTAAALVDGCCSDCGLQLDDAPSGGGCGKPSCGTGGCG